MSKKADTKGITVSKFDDMPEWYSQVCKKAGLAENSPIKGCMVIKPNGYALWEGIQKQMNVFLEEDGVSNAYFPLFIPESFFAREAEHAEGFSPEVAWLERKDDHDERLAVRPTSETIMYDCYSRWIRSWRDLPLRINQWANVVRWEVQDCKMFLRTREFLWQEGHCVYETEDDCHKETLHFLERYRQLIEDTLAIPTLRGRKTARERFAGAKETYGIESVMPDGKSLQMGTSHDLGQNFARAFNIEFQGREESFEHPWQNSWGVSTRMLGAVIMTHGDENGLVIPPRLAKNKLVIIPITFKGNNIAIEEARKLKDELKQFKPLLDDSEDYSAGWKFNKYEMEGVPLRVEIGPKDMEKGQVVLVRRDTREKLFVKRSELAATILEQLEAMHNDLFNNAHKAMHDLIEEPQDYAAFKKLIADRKVALCNHCGNADCEAAIKEDTAATTRVIKNESASGNCIKCEKPGKYRPYFARAY